MEYWWFVQCLKRALVLTPFLLKVVVLEQVEGALQEVFDSQVEIVQQELCPQLSAEAIPSWVLIRLELKLLGLL